MFSLYSPLCHYVTSTKGMHRKNGPPCDSVTAVITAPLSRGAVTRPSGLGTCWENPPGSTAYSGALRPSRGHGSQLTHARTYAASWKSAPFILSLYRTVSELPLSVPVATQVSGTSHT